MFRAPRWQALRGGAATVALPIIAGYVFACIFQHALLLMMMMPFKVSTAPEVIDLLMSTGSVDHGAAFMRG